MLTSKNGVETDRRSGLATWIIIVLGLALSLIVHLTVRGSSFTVPADDWQHTLDVHLHDHPFSTRPLQSYATLGLRQLTGLSTKVSFFSIQFLLAGLTGWLLFRLLLRLGFSRAWGRIGLAMFYLSFPILAAQFAPVHTWDDMWLYAALLGTSYALLDGRWPAVAVLFAVACLARETALFFFPVLAVMAWRDRKQTRPIVLLICLAAPVLAYLAYLWQFDARYSAATWHMGDLNFGSGPRAADADVSLINAFGWLLPAAVAGGYLLWRRQRRESEQFLLAGLLLWLPLNTAAASVLAMVRETRLLFPPFVVVIPLALYAVHDIWRSGLNRVSWRRWFWYALLAGVVCWAGIDHAALYWPKFEYYSSHLLRRNFAGLQLGLSLLFVLLWLHRRIVDRYRTD